MATGGEFDLDVFDKIIDPQNTDLDQAETAFTIEQQVSEDELKTFQQLEEQLSKLRIGQTGFDTALKELTKARVDNFYKSKGFAHRQKPVGDFELRKDGLLYHKETNSRLESKHKIPLSESTLKKSGFEYLNALGLIRPKQNATANARRTLICSEKNN